MISLRAILRRFDINEHLFISIIAVVIGVLGGYGAVLFRYAIIFFQTLLYRSGEEFLTIASAFPGG
jgi:CIC family chloride channel protein